MTVFRLGPASFEDSIRAAQRRRVVLPEEFYGVLQGRARSDAFSVSRLAQLDQVQAVMDSLTEDLRNGGNFEAWRARVLTTPGLGHLTPAHLETIYRTNLQSHYAEGRAASILKHQNTHPFLMYSAILDTRVRPSHAALHGIILPVGHPFWRTHLPPLSFNCRCQVIALTRRQAERRIGAARDQGKVIDQPPPGNHADPGWDYDRLNGSASQGLERAVSRRMDRCTPRLYANNSTPAELVHCRSEEARQALRRVHARMEQGEALEALVREAMGADFDRIAERVVSPAFGLGIPLVEAVALGAMTENKWKRPVSRILRYTTGQRVNGPRSEWVAAMPLVQAVAQGLQRLPVYSGAIRRGVKDADIPSGFVRAHAVGEVVRYAAFTSGGRALGYPLKIRIVGHDGRDISTFAAARFREQREVMIPAGRLFLVERLDADSTIVLRQIADGEVRGRRVHEFAAQP